MSFISDGYTHSDKNNDSNNKSNLSSSIRDKEAMDHVNKVLAEKKAKQMDNIMKGKGMGGLGKGLITTHTTGSGGEKGTWGGLGGLAGTKRLGATKGLGGMKSNNTSKNNKKKNKLKRSLLSSAAVIPSKNLKRTKGIINVEGDRIKGSKREGRREGIGMEGEKEERTTEGRGEESMERIYTTHSNVTHSTALANENSASLKVTKATTTTSQTLKVTERDPQRRQLLTQPTTTPPPPPPPPTTTTHHPPTTNHPPQPNQTTTTDVDIDIVTDRVYVFPETSETPQIPSDVPSVHADSVHADSQSEPVKRGPLYTGPRGDGGNYVRSNSRSMGSCKMKGSGGKKSGGKGGRNKGRHSDRRAINREGFVGFGHEGKDKEEGEGRKMYGRIEREGVEVLDDYLDGKFQSEDNKKVKSGSVRNTPKTHKGGNDNKPNNNIDDGCVRCSRHNRKAKLLVVKKSGKNKGKKFYVCPLPRGEGCDFFMWEMDTGGGIKERIKKSGTKDGWVERKMGEWRGRVNKMTMKEIKGEYGVEGKSKGDMVREVMVWVEGEIRKGCKGGEFKDDEKKVGEVEKTVEEKGIDKEVRGEEIGGDFDVDSDSDDSLEIEGDGMMWGKGQANTTSNDTSEVSATEATESNTSSHTSLASSLDPPSSSQPMDPLTVLRDSFHHKSFLPGQAWAINRVLSSNSSLLVASTGGGKSLTYALPSLILPGLTIVVSPLISLMEDQIRRLPPSCISATLSGSLTKAEQALVVDDLVKGRIKVLFVSPERLCGAAFKRLLRPAYDGEKGEHKRPLPDVSLLCVDEAHCLSQWSHNFRASYMRIRGILKHLQPAAVLALTATAGEEVIDDVCDTLGIHKGRVGEFTDNTLQELDNPDRGDAGKGVRVLSAERGNIDVAAVVVDGEDGRRNVVINMLKPQRKKEEHKGRGRDDELERLGFGRGVMATGSTIVYVWTKKQAEALCDLLKGSGVDGGVTYYHGGMSANDRSSSQARFMKGKCRVIVATVAFGLGIDKGDVRGVIHACLPKSFEHYVQEIGRAGRDGEEAKARCVVIREDAVAQRSLSHGGGVERVQIKGFLDVVERATREVVGDVPEEFREGCVIGELDIGVPVMEAVVGCDVREETVETMASLMEEEEFGRLLRLEGTMIDRVTVTMKKRALEELSEPVAKCIVKCGTKVGGDSASARLEELGGTAMDRGFFAYAKGNWKFGVVRVANSMGQGCRPRHVYAALRRLENKGELEVTVDTSARGKGFLVNLNKSGVEAFREGKGREEVEEKLLNRMREQEESCKKKVDEVWRILWTIFKCNKEEARKEVEEDEEKGSEAAEKKEVEMVERRKKVFSEIVVGYFQGKTNDKEIRATLDGMAIPKINSAKMGDVEFRRLVRDANNIMHDLAFDASGFPEGAVTMGGSGCEEYAARAGLDHPRLAPTVLWNMGEWASWREFDYEEVLEKCRKICGVKGM